MLANFCHLAENISNALPKNANTRAITEQVKKLKQTKEKWSDKIFQTWLNRVIPIFTQEAITQQDNYQSLLLTIEAKMTWFSPWEQGYVELELELNAKYNAFQRSQRRLQEHELQLREDMRALELD